MQLYHGTSSKHLSSILKNGILPTKDTNVLSNWKVESAKDKVYLSDTYALYYAITTAMQVYDDDDNSYDAVVVRVNVDESQFLPDEDYLSGTLSNFGMPATESVIYFRDNLHQFTPKQLVELGHSSLKNLGTVCVPKVEARDIIDYVQIPADDCIKLVMAGCDPNISLIHHKILSEQYKQQLLDIREQYGVKVA